MKVLMLGNSFTYYHDMPEMLAAMLKDEVFAVTRGGACLFQLLDPQDELHAQAMAALERQKWDYVVLQEQSNAPALRPELFHPSVEKLCKLIREKGATPVLYATWAYRENSDKLASTGLTYDEMDQAMYDSYHAAAWKNQALTADVGKGFSTFRQWINLYEADDYHPSDAGSLLAARIIAETIQNDWKARESRI